MAWDRVTSGDLNTLGYSLELLQDDDTWLQVYDASTNPDAFETVVYGLKSGKFYTFRAFAYNFNGPSLPSNYFSVYACGLPRHLSEPLYVISTESSISIKWTLPLDDGGCPISDF